MLITTEERDEVKQIFNVRQVSEMPVRPEPKIGKLE